MGEDCSHPTQLCDCQLFKYGFGSSPPVDLSLTLDNVLSLDIFVRFGYLDRRGPTRGLPYKPVLLRRLRHLCVRMFDDYDDLADQYTPNLFLSANFLSHLNPSSLAMQLVVGEDRRWQLREIPRSVWFQATSTWNRLRSISLIDIEFPELYDRRHVVDGDQHRTYEHLTPSDLPGCTMSISLSWTFTKHIGGHDRATTHRVDEEDWSPVLKMCNLVDSWSRVQGLDVPVTVGARRKDRAALREDMEELSEEFRSRILICS